MKMAEQNRDSSMEEILSSIKRIIAEDKAIEVDAPAAQKKAVKPALKAVPDMPAEDGAEILELTNEVSDNGHSQENAAQGVFGDRRKEERLIDDKKLDSMRQSLSALVSGEKSERPVAAQPKQGTSLEDLTRDLMRPMIKNWLDDNLPSLVEELVAREVRRISEK